jgi:ribosomal protein S18 acetylase RimI-like enzyme
LTELALETRNGAVTGRRLDCFTSDAAADALQRSFEGYFVPMHLDGDAFERRFRAEHVDRRESYIYVQGSQIAGVILVARRGRASRVAAMACAPAFRRYGLGTAMLETALVSARERGDETMTLEVLEPNIAARALYEKLSFRVVRELVGYTHDGERQSSDGELQECSAETYAQALSRQAFADLPWMLSADTACGQTLPARFFHVDNGSFIWLASAGEKDLTIRFLFTVSERCRQGLANLLLCRLERRFPDRKWSISPVVPDGMGSDFLRGKGFEFHELRQIEMVRALDE